MPIDLTKIIQGILKPNQPVIDGQIPIGNDLPSQGGIMGNQPYDLAGNGLAPKLSITPTSEDLPVVQPANIDGKGIAQVNFPQPQMPERPRIVPNQPVTDETPAGLAPQLPIASQEDGGRPRIAEEQPVYDMTPPSTGLAPKLSNKWEDEYNRIKGKDYSKTKNPDGTVAYGKDYDQGKGWKHKALDILKTAGIGFLRNGIGGAIEGGIEGAIDPNADARMIDDYKLQGLAPKLDYQRKIDDDNLNRDYKQAQIDLTVQKPEIQREQIRSKVEAATTAFNRRMSVLDQQQKFAGGQWEKYVDGQGRVSKKYKDGRLEPVINSVTGEQDTDPLKLTYDVYDPITKQTVKANGQSVLGYSGAIQAGNAQREQQANITNAQFDFQAQKTNADAVGKYNGDILSQAMAIAKAQGGMGNDLAEAEGYNTEIQAINTQIQSFNPEDDPERYNKLVDKMNELSGKLISAVGKTKSGAEVLTQMKAKGISAPPMVKAPKVKPVVVNGGSGKYAGQVFASPASLKSAFPNKSEAEIKQIIEANGGKFQ